MSDSQVRWAEWLKRAQKCEHLERVYWGSDTRYWHCRNCGKQFAAPTVSARARGAARTRKAPPPVQLDLFS